MLGTKKKIVIILAVLLCMIMAFVSPILTYRVYAETTTHSNVLDDLKNDPSFDPNDYPADPGDYRLKVIQVAESSDGKLLLYVFNPCYKIKDLRASKVNISRQDPSEAKLSYKRQSLTFINSSGGFSKYVVNDFDVLSEAYRYYTIANIYRPYIEGFDDPAMEDDDVKEHVGVKVAQSWCLHYYNGQLKCESKTIDVKRVEIHSVGFTRINQNIGFYQLDTDSHFVAFSVVGIDNIDAVYDATIAYDYCSSFKSINDIVIKEEITDEKTDQEIRISDTNFEVSTDYLFFNKTYVMDRIIPVSIFIEETRDFTNEYISEENENALATAQYVIRFYETPYRITYGLDGSVITESTYVSNVSVLQLHFLSDMHTYNVGVVSDIVSDDGIPDYIVTLGDNIRNGFEDMWYVYTIVIVILIAIFFQRPLEAFFKLIWSGIKLLFEWLIFLITFPYRLVITLFKKR